MKLIAVIDRRRHPLVTDPKFDNFVVKFLEVKSNFDYLTQLVMGGHHEANPEIEVEYQAARQERIASVKFARENKVFGKFCPMSSTFCVV